VSAADDAAPVSAAEARTLFGPLAHASALVLAVSGGPDSTALLMLAARWRSALTKGPKLIAVTIDHALRRESAGEARAVKGLARALGVAHRTLRWEGEKPSTGLQQAAREARYRLLAAAAGKAKAGCILTAHTLDDQAETVLIRMSRGSGLTGLAAMARVSPVPACEDRELVLVRPLLDIPKARLVATLAEAKIDSADDPSNRDPRFARARLRDMMPMLAREGLDARGLALLAGRLRRAEAAIEVAVDVAAGALSEGPWPDHGPIGFDAERFSRLPAEVALRLLGRAISHAGNEGPVQLGKLETLYEVLACSGPKASPGRGFGGTSGRPQETRQRNAPRGANASETMRLRRTLAGALVTLTATRLLVDRAPARSAAARSALTTGKYGVRGRREGR
jgi:tRNA(Ile)-lysidine synthase